jgi:hypothetical protein
MTTGLGILLAFALYCAVWIVLSIRRNRFDLDSQIRRQENDRALVNRRIAADQEFYATRHKVEAQQMQADGSGAPATAQVFAAFVDLKTRLENVEAAMGNADRKFREQDKRIRGYEISQNIMDKSTVINAAQEIHDAVADQDPADEVGPFYCTVCSATLTPAEYNKPAARSAFCDICEAKQAKTGKAPE